MHSHAVGSCHERARKQHVDYLYRQLDLNSHRVSGEEPLLILRVLQQRHLCQHEDGRAANCGWNADYGETASRETRERVRVGAFGKGVCWQDRVYGSGIVG